MADRARAPSDTLLGDVRALGLAQTTRSVARAGDLRRQAGPAPDALWGLFLRLVRCIGVLTSFWTVRSVDRPLGQLIGAAERFGGGDLRPIQLGAAMPDRDRAAGPRDGRHGRAAPRRRACRWSARPARSATAPATSPP